MAKKKDDKLKASVVVTVEVDKVEWMERFGDHITKNNIVPEVTLAKFAVRSVKDKVVSMNMKSLEVRSS